MIPFRYLVVGVVLLSCFVGTNPAAAHEGPPFPILMDEQAAGCVVSVWADPDIGEAQFFVIIESPPGGPPKTVPRVSVWVEPVSGRLKRVEYNAKQRSLRNQVQFEALPHFDQRDRWRVGIQIVAPGGESQELITEVESTPPGYGLWDLAIYLFPFLLLGAMWIIAISRRQRLRRINGSIARAEVCDFSHKFLLVN